METLNFGNILLIAVGLSADCFAVSLGVSVSCKNISLRQILRMAFLFGFFQAGMLLLGWLAGTKIVDLVANFDHWIAFGLLAFVGGKMIWEATHEGKEHSAINIDRLWTLITLSVATSIDSLAVGLSFAFLTVNMVVAAISIGLVSLIVPAIGAFIGKRVGELVGKRAEIIGGIILIIIGLRILLDHLL